MKLSKQELISKINDKIEDIDLATELMEDIADSIPDDMDEILNKYKTEFETEKANLEAQIANEKAYITELKQRYRERFLKGDEEVKEEKPTEDGMEEKEVIDVKEI